MHTNNDVYSLIEQLRQILVDFEKKFSITDIVTNSKIFEILIADSLDHLLIPGHSGSRDAKNENNEEFEYKHYKESSSNHSWTFNDFSDITIDKLKNTKAVIFAHIQDENVPFPIFDWYYEVPGSVVSEYLSEAVQSIKNNRKMINISPKQIEEKMSFAKQTVKQSDHGRYSEFIQQIITITAEIESVVGTKDILTSNKFWEVLVALKLEHKVQSEQAKHDAVDSKGNTYEYKVSKSASWSFQDISKEVLNKYLENKSIILAIVDKDKFSVEKIYEADAKKVVILLRKKLIEKDQRYKSLGKQVRRLQISLSITDVRKLKANLIYPKES